MNRLLKHLLLQPKTDDSIECFNANFIREIWPKFGGKYKFCYTITIPINLKVDTSIRNDFIERDYKPYPDSLNLNGFEIIPNYKTTIARVNGDEKKGNYYYPVYIVNQTPSTKVYIGIYAIQEALDENGDWRPIEGQRLFFDNIGIDFALKVHAREFVIILIPKYRGNFKTKLRVRIKSGDNIYVTNPFDGIINKNQFFLDKKQCSFHYRNLLRDKTSAILDLFYGAVPLECD